MTFSEAEKAAITSMLAKAAGKANKIGAEVLERVFLKVPQTKASFINSNLSHNSKDLLSHGENLMKTIGNAAQHLDDANHAVSCVNDLCVQNLMADPVNFIPLSSSIKETLADNFLNEFKGSIVAAWDKFLSEVLIVLATKY